jgi:hypothetical protein
MLRIITSKLFEAQSALSRHRFKLAKRMKNPIYEREQKMSLSLKKRIIDQYQKTKNETTTEKWLLKRTPTKEIKEQREENTAKRRKLTDNTNTQNVNSSQKEQKVIIKKVRRKKTKTPHKTGYRHNTNKRKLSMEEMTQGDINPYKIRKHTDNREKGRKTVRTVARRPRTARTHALSYNINPTGKLGHRGLPIRRGWYSFLRHTYNPKYQIRIKHKLNCRTDLQLKKKQK